MGRLLGLVFPMLFLAGRALAQSEAPAPPPPPPAPRPNIVLLLTDDLDLRSMEELPGLRPLLQDAGTSFSHAYVSVSLCCPSRSTLLRGQYSHNTGVYGNSGKFGGYGRFVAMGDEDSTIGTWLQAAGYRTGFFGKYMNGYPEEKQPLRIPVGWSTWFVPALGHPYTEYNYSVNHDGRLVAHGDRVEDYFTDVMAAEANRFIHSAAAAGQPFYLQLNSYSPHSPETPAPRHKELFPGAQVPRSPAFNEEDMNDKPSWLRRARPLDAEQIKSLDARYRRRLQSMAAVIELLGGLIEQLRADGQLDRTYIVFSSDNGFHFGEHRLPFGKNTPYDTDLRVPLIIRGPGVPAGRVVDALAVNTDLAPTFAALAGIRAPEWVDGRSLVPWLSPPLPDAPLPEAPLPLGRRAFLMEHRSPASAPTAASPSPGAGTRESSGLLEHPDNPEPTKASSGRGPEKRGKRKGSGPRHELRAPVFMGLHTAERVYVEYKNGEREVYDLVADPHQLQNLATTTPPSELALLHEWLGRLRSCAGPSCLEAEDRPPEGLGW